jgi:hypothetical protein
MIRLRLLLLLVSVLVLAPAASAAAGVLVRSAGPCDGRSLDQPFLPWLDPAQYALEDGGDFESSGAGWALTGPAAVTPGSETFAVHSSDDASALALPAGSSATTPSTCVGLGHPTLRLFARNSGSPLSTLRVDVSFETSLGLTLTVPVGVVAAGPSWQPTLPLPVVANLLPLLPRQRTAVTFRFTPQGRDGAWEIDDVYVDPWARR